MIRHLKGWFFKVKLLVLSRNIYSYRHNYILYEHNYIC